MSSNPERGRIAAALDSGADDFISKPPEPEELRARLRAAERVVTLQRELMRLADTDPLTGLLNRRALFRQAEEACIRAATGRSLAVAMIDIDHFKHINDQFGHTAGDRAIRAVADRIAASFAITGRLGGEEFVGMIENATAMQAASAAEHLRASIAKLRFEDQGNVINITISAGVSTYQPGETIDIFFQRADTALYDAKRNGRNRVSIDEAFRRQSGLQQAV
jgi:two-component system, cell cycle response regulator